MPGDPMDPEGRIALYDARNRPGWPLEAWQARTLARARTLRSKAMPRRPACVVTGLPVAVDLAGST